MSLATFDVKSTNIFTNIFLQDDSQRRQDHIILRSQRTSQHTGSLGSYKKKIYASTPQGGNIAVVRDHATLSSHLVGCPIVCVFSFLESC